MNVTGTLLCCQHAARLMQRNSFGRIINIASVAEMRGQSAERPSKKEAAQRAAS
ncbi:SDR family NAD(P)-dependent oxidoreductase [Pseudomonas shirazensis]|uniref:SDR family NAD(P)-dependent oxidoreductase n=1 Tax=Pseudomonas shirazensis TaxID=2745494 RepID=UPI00398844C2